MPEHPDPNRWKEVFKAAAAQWGLPQGLLEKVAEVESNFNPEARSEAGAIGLMQIIPRFHPDVDPTDPVESINYAARYLSELKDRFGGWDLALAAYNAGPTNVRRHGGIPPFPETQNYVKRITEAVPFDEPSRLDQEIGPLQALFDGLTPAPGGRQMLPDATRVSIPEQVEARTLAEQIQTKLAEPDATRVAPQSPRPSLLQQVSSRLPRVQGDVHNLFTH